MTTPDAPVRVLIVDDQPLVRGGFRMLVDSQPDLTVVADVDDGAAAVECVRATAGAPDAADVILMDVRMPRLNGIEATREVLRLRPDVRIIVLTTFDLDEYALEAIRAGASGFLLKDARPEELLDAIRTVARGDAVIAPSTTRRLLSHLVAGPGGEHAASAAGAATAQPAGPGSPSRVSGAAAASGAAVPATAAPGAAASDGAPSAARTPLGAQGTPPTGAGVSVPSPSPGAAGAVRDPWGDPRLSSLTAREREVFELMGGGCSNGEIMQRLFLSEPTVKTHVSHILAKLRARDRVQAVVIAYETGVVLPG